MMYSHSKTEKLPDARREPMDWSRLPKYMLGPVQKFLMKRALIIYSICAVIGMLPSFFENQVDMNFKKGPGTMLGTSAVAAREMGDYEFADALLKKADELMERVDDPACLYYKKTSVTANASIVLARFSQTDDLYHLIHHGPTEEALKGPVLEECSYPEVLVAKARSHTGTGLELILYDGAGPGSFEIGLTRLEGGANYIIKETGESFTADENGRVKLTVDISGRTPVTIVREGAGV